MCILYIHFNTSTIIVSIIYLRSPGLSACDMLFQSASPPSLCTVASPSTSPTNSLDRSTTFMCVSINTLDIHTHTHQHMYIYYCTLTCWSASMLSADPCTSCRTACVSTSNQSTNKHTHAYSSIISI